KININMRIPSSSNNRGNKNNSRNSRRIPTTTLNMSTTANQNNQNNNQNNNLQNFFNGLNLPQGNNGERNLVKIPFFKGNDDEDLIEWLEFVERAFEANSVQDNRKIAVAAAHLKDMAGDWYERDRNNINQWYQQGQQGNFKDRFIEAFSSRVRRDRWNDALENIK